METNDLGTQPFVVSLMSQNGNSSIPQEAEQHNELHAGDQCPACLNDYLDYDGLLNLTCPSCGYALGGCFT
jgi:hypothetical protein